MTLTQNRVSVNERYKIFLEIFVACIFALNLHAQSDSYIQDVKAVFIYNFTKYIHWADDSNVSTFKIAVIGDAQILIPLQKIAEKRKVNQKKIEIKYFKDPEDIDVCHILFISESGQQYLDEIVTALAYKKILIVSEIKGSLNRGVMINFLISQETIKFEINLHAMKKAAFLPGSELLKLAVRVIE